MFKQVQKVTFVGCDWWISNNFCLFYFIIFWEDLLNFVLIITCMTGSSKKCDSHTLYSAAQICPNQNIRVMRVSPIRVYAYAHTHVRVCIYAHTRIQYIRVCLISMYELAYCFFFSYRSLLFSMA